jgi:hypothetical protein
MYKNGVRLLNYINPSNDSFTRPIASRRQQTTKHGTYDNPTDTVYRKVEEWKKARLFVGRISSTQISGEFENWTPDSRTTSLPRITQYDAILSWLHFHGALARFPPNPFFHYPPCPHQNLLCLQIM